MTTDELNAIVQAVMTELEKAGVDFDFKAETPQPTDLVYVMRGTADKYQGITVRWQNLLDIIVQKATEAKDEAVSAKDIALQTLATIQGIESNVNSMKSSVETSESNVASMKASVEASEANVTQMKSDVTTMKTSAKGTKTEVEGLLDTKVNYSDSLTYEQIMASTDLTNKVASASSIKTIESVKKPKIIGSNELNGLKGTISFTLEQNRIYLFACMHDNNNNTGFAIIGTYGSTASIYNIVPPSLITLSADGYTLTITINYGHVWSLIQLD